ncbi:RNA polymerase sigma factor [Humisphaera borealis]|uniref:Sigma-70 family RNA polymerase sigma factor n=1 Tax=Humisphaera borealis TaxID=2807512 RepID=A0A7M2WTE4_9BACT|nr:hypothetical protein [Humisphaera borealis]QOV88081.1 hypothetical protein IPV69_17675 [Humisphaera borealis]
MTEIGEDTLERARSGNRRAIEAVFRQVHPGVCRLVRALCGDADFADRIVDISFRHALTVLPRWNEHVDPEHWFSHHALQTVRRVSPGRPDSADDLLVKAVASDQQTPAWAAFVRGIRRLPPQQAEAFILHHGQRMNSRLLGVSMDCSTTAAENHLRAADNAMRALAGEQFEPLTRVLRTAVVALGPSPDVTEQFVTARVGAWADRRSAVRIARLVFLTVVISLLALAWIYRADLLRLIGLQ